MSIVQAMRLASFGARVFAGPREAWLHAAEIVKLATQGGAKLLGLNSCGRIEQGACADLALFDLNHVDFIPNTDPINQLVTCADSASVTDVMVGGAFKVRDRNVISVDVADLRSRIDDCVARLAATTSQARPLPSRLEPPAPALSHSLHPAPLSPQTVPRPQPRPPLAL